MRRASWMSLGMMVTRLAWMAQRLVSSKRPTEVRLGGLLEREHGGALEAQVGLEVLGDLADEALERELADEQLRRLLVAADLAQGDGARAVAVRLLDAARRRRALARGLGRELLARRLAAGRLARRLLRASHDINDAVQQWC